MPGRRHALAVLAALAGAGLACASWPPLPPAPPMDPARIERDVAWLADDAREGRGIGTAGLAEAAAFLARELEAAGFEPAGTDGFFQPFEMPVSIRVGEALLEVPGLSLLRGEQFEALLSSASDTLEAEIVFAGHGISAPEAGWDDYAGLDAEGRIVLVLDDRPAGDGPLAGLPGIPFLRRAYKLSNARRHGAAAVLLAPAAADSNAPAGNAGLEPANPTRQSSGMPVLGLNRGAAEALIALAGGPSLAARQEAMARSGEPRSAPLGTRGRVSVRVERDVQTVANVVARLGGGDPLLRGEAVVIGAHFDHLGRGAFGSLDTNGGGEIHNGADDNASGTAGLLELARAFASAPRARRSLIIAAFTAEEAGLVGSREYVEHPPVPLEDTVAMINLDMIGRLEAGDLAVFGTETATGFDVLIARATGDLPLRVEAGAGGFAPSDQTSFYARDVPVLMFFTGAHAEYHTPQDTAGRIDPEGEATVLAAVYRVARHLLDASDRPVVVASRAPAASGAGGAPGYGPYLGTVPDFVAGDGPGVGIQGVRPGSPAELAGLEPGDRIVSFDGGPVANLEEYAALLYGARPGDRVEIVILRDGKRIALEATLGQRR